MFGFPSNVRTPCLVMNAQSVSILVAFASRVRLCVASSPVPVTVPDSATCPPRGHCFVTVNALLIVTGTAAEAAASAVPTFIENDGLMPTSDWPRVATASMSAASWIASAWVNSVGSPVDDSHAARPTKRAAPKARRESSYMQGLRGEVGDLDVYGSVLRRSWYRNGL